ncbi:cytochrome C oxidase subunit IV family protein [Salinilacihabitans rarus]|uniref:cytochrome C oxidase subunit IV family protein n=1 Tax=Salinilacihabitans rarus TaxID=2961596 RepID=UPI0020C87A4C|nr:cytochrome C oxidase subunit IV family protein [Salinilacihabitans rarus]
MSKVRTYAIIYVALLALGTGKFIFFEFDFDYQLAMAGTLALATTKSLLIAGYYQHLIEEPRSIAYLMASAVFAVFLLTIAAGYSIQ